MTPRHTSRPQALVVRPEPFDAEVSKALIAELMADLDVRYGADDTSDAHTAEMMALWAVRPEQVRPPLGVFLVAWLDGEPAGCGAIRPLLGSPPGVGEVKRMYTAPRARRRGVSRAILARLEREAALLGYRRLQLETGLRQPEAIALYDASGWYRIPTFGQYEGDELSVCFAKDLLRPT
jgi:GNAT superfamily N-acetyltransferase